MRGRRDIPAENRFCAVSTAAMTLNASLDGVSSPRSGVLLSVDKSFSQNVSPVTAQITGLNEAIGFSDEFGGRRDGTCSDTSSATSGWAILVSLAPLFIAAVEQSDFLCLVVPDATCWREHDRRS